MAENKKKPVFSLLNSDMLHYQQTEKYAAAVEQMYFDSVNEFAVVASKTKINPDKLFSFSDYPQIKNASNNIITKLATRIQLLLFDATETQWFAACEKNDKFLSSIMDTSQVPKEKLEKWQDKNLDALSSFQKRKVAGMDLSKRIWNYAGQMKTQMELGIDIALGEGNSAHVLSKELRQYLVDPDKLFRRVRDKHGNLKLSKAAEAFHPGQGKYRSSYKNAMRLTRSEINMAYRTSDHLRWEKLDFVVGFEVKLSNNHTLNGKPFFDICDQLAGRYPKSFVFKGWHPQCRCHAVPVLMDQEEFNTDELNELKAALKGTEYKKFASKNTVSDVPDTFKTWVANNVERSQNWKSQPYFIRENFNGGTLAGGLKVAEMPKLKPQKAIKSPSQKADIQKRWNTRSARNKFGNEINEIEKQFGSVGSISDFIGKVETVIESGAPVNNVSFMVNMLKHKVNVKIAWDERKAVNALGSIIPDVKKQLKIYSVDELKTVYSAVEAKLKTFEGLPISKQAEKLKFEIEWVEKNQKYSTWKVAQDSYKKALDGIHYQVQKQAISDNIQVAIDFAKSTKSTIVKEMASDIQKMLVNNAPISEIQAKANELNVKVKKLVSESNAKKAKKNLGPVNEDAFSKERKDQALWAKSAKAADAQIRDVVGNVWKNASLDQRTAAYRYTAGSSYINEPLRGQYYSGQYLGKYNGKADADSLSALIDKCSYDFDMWIQRGVGYNGANGLFGTNISGLSLNDAKGMLLGKVVTEPAFSSCAVTKGAGFSHQPVIYNIYCPRGTKMLYSEPFSAYGHGSKSPDWNGITKQSSFGSEAEMILQKATKFRVTKVENNSGKWFIDMEVVGQ